jgi:hypothetical protein
VPGPGGSNRTATTATKRKSMVMESGSSMGVFPFAYTKADPTSEEQCAETIGKQSA